MQRAMSRRAVMMAGLAASLLADLATAAQIAPAAMRGDDGELFHVGPSRDPVRIKVSPSGQGRFAMIAQQMAPGSRIPIHLHEREDEIIFIHSGNGTATLGEKQSTIGAGSVLYVPQGTWHGGENSGDTVMWWIAIYSPSGFEGYFREIGTRAPKDTPVRRSAEEWAELDRKYGIRYRR